MAKNKLPIAVRELGWQIAPAFPQGKGAKTLFKAWQAQAQGNEFLDRFTYDRNTKTIKGSSAIMNPRLDTMLRPLGIRVATTTDIYSNPGIQAILKDKFCTDDPALILRGHENKGYEKNTSFIAQLVELVEKANGKIEFPLVIRGFDYQPAPKDTKGYRLKVIARGDFSAIQDNAFKEENHGKNFTTVKPHGAPEFDRKGKFTFYAKDNSTLARLYVNSNLGLGSDYDALDYTDDFGRVVLLPDEVGAREILDARFKDLQKTRDTELAALNKRYQKAEAVLRGDRQ